jgi:hypothetical protein
MDGVSEDFSGLPEYKTRGEKRAERVDRIWSERRNNPYRGRRARIILVGGFAVALLVLAISLIVLFAPAPYMGTNYSSIAKSVGTASPHDCRPGGSGWICAKEAGGTVARYDVKVDWAGCWSGKLIGPTTSRGDAQPKISGCVSVMDHLKAG